jgi:hypothetical protein
MGGLQDACDYLGQAIAGYSTARSIPAVESAILAMHTGLETAFRAYLKKNNYLPIDIREALEKPGKVSFPNLVDLMGDYTDVLDHDPSLRALLVSLNTTRARIAHPLDKPSQEQIINDARRFAEVILAIWPRLCVGRREPRMTPVTMGMVGGGIAQPGPRVTPSPAPPSIDDEITEGQQSAQPQPPLLRSLWQGETRPSRWLGKLLGGLIIAGLARLAWKPALVLARWPPPAKTAGIVLAITTLGLAAWSGWRLWRVFRLLGLRRVLILLSVVYLSMVSVRVLTAEEEQPLAEKILLQMQSVAGEAWGTLAGFPRSLVEAPATFRFAYTGQRPLVAVPGVEVNPTPIEGEIIDPPVYTVLDEFTLTVTPATIHTPVPSEPGVNGGIQIGGYVQVHSTGGKTLRARSGPGTDHEVVMRLAEGTQLLVLEGPVEANGYVWWKVRGDQSEGWCADRWLMPVR